MSRTGWIIAGLGAAYFFLTARAPSSQQAVVTIDPLGQPNQAGPDTFAAPDSALPYQYGSQYGNTAQPMVPFQGFGVNAKFTGDFQQNTGLQGEVAPVHDSGSYSRIGSVY